MSNESYQFWFFWLLTVLIISQQVFSAFRVRLHVLSYPFFAAVAGAYIYTYMAYEANARFSHLFRPWMLALGQCMVVLTMLAILIGWQWAMRAQSRRQPSPVTFDWNDVWRWGLFFAALGIAGIYTFYTGRLEMAKHSAYWYLLYHVAYPGVALMLFAMLREPRLSRPFNWALLVVVVVLAMAKFAIATRRGPLFPMAVVLLFTPTLARRKAPNQLYIASGLVTAGFLMLVFLSVRMSEGKTFGEKWSAFIARADAVEVLRLKAVNEGDNEFLYHCYLIATAWETGRYQYGTMTIGLLTHWIPRQLWRDKPGLGQGWFEPATPYMQRVVRNQMTRGAAAGGIASVFLDYGLLTPLFFLLLSYVQGRLLARGWYDDDPRMLVAYIGLACSWHWLMAQGFVAAFVPAMAYQVIPWVAFRLSRRKPVSQWVRRPAFEAPRVRTTATQPIG